MDFVTWGNSPWDQPMLVRISWDLLWASALAGVLFLLAHGSYMLFTPHHKSDPKEVDRLEAAAKNLPAKIQRHSLGARMFHWVMAASMFTLLFTAFLPVVGVRFAWVQWHWMAGVVLVCSILFHIFHTLFFLDFWSIWITPRDLGEMRTEMLRDLGHAVEGPKPGKYPLGNRLYHMALVVTGLTVTATGVLMMSRVRTPFFTRDPYILADSTWGLTYVIHGLCGVGLVGLTMAHVYFALRPEKLWITKAMLFGTITRREYVEHHDPNRWVVKPE